MSNTESFESVVNESFEIAKAKLRITFEGKLFERLLSDLQAAHDREIRDTAQQEYHRGFEDGRHCMDAEHRAVAMRLRALPMNKVGYAVNLFDIEYAVCNDWNDVEFRDKLIDLMGGVSDDTAEPMTTDEFIECINQDTRRLKGDGAMEVSDDTCDSQCRGACAAGDGRDSGEQKEVGDGRTGDSCTRSHSLRSVGRNDVCMCRDSGEHSRGQEVEHGGTTHDCADDSRGRSGCDVVHLDGLVAYDVLDNERRKAIAELRKLPERYKDDGKRSPAGRFNEALSDAIGVEGLPSFAKIRDRLIHLLGGDQPSGIDVLRAMDADGTCPNDDLTSSITDELRECVDTATKMYEDVQWYELDESEEADHTVCHVTEGELLRIADHIDDRFDRICQQQEAVLQETIAEVVKEYEHDRLPDQLRIEKLVEQRDEMRQECADMLDLLRDARDEYKTLDRVSSETSANFHAMRDRVWIAEAERDELQAKLDEYDQTHMELPRDSGGECWHVGDMSEVGKVVCIKRYAGNTRFRWHLFVDHGDGTKQDYHPSELRHDCGGKPDTAESIVRDLGIGAVTEAEAIRRIEALNG